MQINFNDWEFHELSKELRDMSLHQMLNKYKALEAEMTNIAKAYTGTTQTDDIASKNEEKYNAVHRQQVYTGVRIAERMIGF